MKTRKWGICILRREETKNQGYQNVRTVWSLLKCILHTSHIMERKIELANHNGAHSLFYWHQHDLIGYTMRSWAYIMTATWKMGVIFLSGATTEPIVYLVDFILFFTTVFVFSALSLLKVFWRRKKKRGLDLRTGMWQVLLENSTIFHLPTKFFSGITIEWQWVCIWSFLSLFSLWVYYLEEMSAEYEGAIGIDLGTT
jgi:hypothetical protein